MGNILDAEGDEENSTDLTVVFHEDGRLTVPRMARYTCLLQMISLFLRIQSGRAACTSQTDFFPIVFRLMSHYPALKSNTTVQLRMSIFSSLMEGVGDLAFNASLDSGALASDATDPGALPRVVASTACWVDSVLDMECCAVLLRRILNYGVIAANFQRAGGVRQLVQLLKALICVGYGTHPRSWSASASIVFGILCSIRSTNLTHSSLLEAIDEGLIYILHYLSAPTLGTFIAGVQATAGRFVQSELIHQLIWPAVRCAFGSAVKRDRIVLSISGDRWPIWNVLVTHFIMCEANQASVKLQPQFQCNNFFCTSTGGRKLRMCACTTSFYCSKRCQKTHWRAGHRQECRRDFVVTVIDSQGLSLTYIERSSIKFVALVYALRGSFEEATIYETVTSSAIVVHLDCFDASGPRVRLITDANPDMDGRMHVYATVTKVRKRAILLVATVKRSRMAELARNPALLAAPENVPLDLFAW
ncbi:hypothetical protein K523DRAFT_357725 [Schizophyllum commune Tattone D]|nr:hypothetical protein K523DRAFT_357725 [Schizophyllum commune Tattone D]